MHFFPGMWGSEEGKQVLIKWDPHGEDHDAHGERADHEEPQEPEPGAAGWSQRGAPTSSKTRPSSNSKLKTFKESANINNQTVLEYIIAKDRNLWRLKG